MRDKISPIKTLSNENGINYGSNYARYFIKQWFHVIKFGFHVIKPRFNNINRSLTTVKQRVNDDISNN